MIPHETSKPTSGANLRSMEATADCEEPPAKKRKGDKGNPPGIFDHPSGKKQARLPGFKVGGKACQKPIPGLFADVQAAVAGQLEAQQKLASGGPEAVWPNWAQTTERNKRGEVPPAHRSATL